MFLGDILFAFLFALLFTLLFSLGFRRKGPWESLLLFLLIVFLAAWAAGVWVAPFGPALWGVYWFPFLLFALIFALILAAATPARPRNAEYEIRPDREQETAVETAISAFVWVLLVVFLLMIVISYI